MGMFPKNPSNPLGEGKVEHVVSIGVGPIGNGHPNTLASHHPPDADEQPCHETVQHCKPAKCGGCQGGHFAEYQERRPLWLEKPQGTENVI